MYVPPVYTPEELLQRCEECIEHFPEENRTVIVNKTGLLTNVMDILLQDTIDPAVEAQARLYYALLVEERKRREPPKNELPPVDTPPSPPPAPIVEENISDVRERFIIADVMRITKMQRQIFKKKMQEIEEGNTGSFSQEIFLEQIASQLASQGVFHADNFSEKETGNS